MWKLLLIVAVVWPFLSAIALVVLGSLLGEEWVELRLLAIPLSMLAFGQILARPGLAVLLARGRPGSGSRSMESGCSRQH